MDAGPRPPAARPAGAPGDPPTARGERRIGLPAMNTAPRAIHHLNCGTMCPRGARLLAGEGGWLASATTVCHCLLVEGAEGLVLVDTGFGIADTRNPR